MSANIIKARDKLVEEIEKEFIGPGSEGYDGLDANSERISENPLKRYALGILYPQYFSADDDIISSEIDNEEDKDIEEMEVEPDAGENIDNAKIKNSKLDEKIGEQSIRSANQYCPSSYGLTFFVLDKSPKIMLNIEAAKYRRLLENEAYVNIRDTDSFIHSIPDREVFKLEDNKYYFKSSTNVGYLRDKLGNNYLKFSRIHDKARNFKTRGYLREPIIILNEAVELGGNKIILETKYPDIVKVIINCREAKDNILKVTVSVVNTNKLTEKDSKYSRPDLCLFQNKIEVVRIDKTEYIHINKLSISPSISKADDLLYNNRRIYAVGHGCSVDWDHNTPPKKICTTYLPKYEVPKVESFPDRIKKLNLKIFSMRYLAYHDNKQEVIDNIHEFIHDYKIWIDEISNESSNYSGDKKYYAEINVEQCMVIQKRMLEGINILKTNDIAWDAFQLSNEAMLMQRYHTVTYVRNPRTINDPWTAFPEHYNEVSNDIAQWRPFQLAFILINIDSIVNPESDNRNVADLLWFPTGGGKTEAYLGVIALTILFRRMAYKMEGGGTAVIMRYTLRLLTTQQYERASTLISACEFIRRRDVEKLGNEEITIGLWVGRDNTPNNQKVAEEMVSKLINSKNDFINNNPFQVINCPWCGTQIFNDDAPMASGYVASPKFYIKCIDKRCIFFKRLPLQVIDEHLYDNAPTLLFATVDKFARIAWEPKCKSFFGLNSNGDDYNKRPPEIILQDELHLISGPLGSMFGIYEAVIDYLCKYNDCKPKNYLLNRHNKKS
jgi:hypothetical protein